MNKRENILNNIDELFYIQKDDLLFVQNEDFTGYTVGLEC